MRKILLVHDAFDERGGGEIMLLRVARIFSKLGFHVDLKLFWGHGKGLNQIDRALFHSIETLQLPGMSHLIRSWRSVARILPMKMDWQRQNYEGIFAFSLRSAVRAAFVAQSINVPFGWMCQQSLPLFGAPYQSAKQWVGVKMLQRANAHIVCIANETYEAFQKMGFETSQLSLIRNGIQREYFAKTRQFRQSKRLKKLIDAPRFDLTVAMVARIDPIKGHDELIKAVRDAKMRGVNVGVICVGGASAADEAYKRELLNTVERFGLTDNFIWTGHKHDIRPYLALAECLVLPSYKEAQGLVLAEGVAAGLGVIGRNVGGIPEFIEHDTNGLLFGGESYPSLAECFLTYARNKVQLDLHKSAAEVKVAAEYDSVVQDARWRKAIEDWLKPAPVSNAA